LLCISIIDGYFKEINSAFIKKLGYTENELLSKPLSLIHPDDVNKTPQEIIQLLQGQTSIAFKNRYFKRLVESSIEWTISVDS
jgi:PAS domain S-box-containing protein